MPFFRLLARAAFPSALLLFTVPLLAAIPLLAAGLLLAATGLPGPAAAQSSAPIVQVPQGADWTSATRDSFYTQDQGSRIMPLSWMRALALPDGRPFLGDGLARYGYLPMPGRSEAGLPVGFTTGDFQTETYIGMTCSACHTRQITVSGTPYRIDGGPGIVDFQNFLKDLDDSVQKVVNDAATFTTFADGVLGPDGTEADKAKLKATVDAWAFRFHTLVTRSLPTPAWGPSRLDAVSMIFNRLAGLDIGEAPTFVIAENIAVADAPTRYPFLWNAARQDKTQWPGFADNGNSILGLARNLGEVYGVFAIFHPQKQSGLFRLDRNYLAVNSANFDGLKTVEDLIWKIGPPQWLWSLDSTLVAQGKDVFDRPTDEGGCVECHGIEKGAFRSPFHETWATPVQDVGTDTRECNVLTRMVDTGVMAGASIPVVEGTLKERDTAFNVLSTTVLGAIIQNAVGFSARSSDVASSRAEPPRVPEFDYLRGAFREPPPMGPQALTTGRGQTPKSGCAYESRVLQGIWAAAPYLHNGSVATLADLLKPAEERTPAFKIGPAYDIEAVGLAVEQTKFDYTLETTGCEAIDSGNSRCGHEFGTTTLSDTEKAALLEYLKSL